MLSEVLGSAMLWPAQQLINSLLRSDRHLQQQLSALEGRSLAIQVYHLPLAMMARIGTGGLSLRAVNPQHYEMPADVTIAGSMTTLIRLVAGDHAEQPLVNEELQISGDSQLLVDLSGIIRRLDIQWEDLLGPVLGDIATHQLSQAVHNSRVWARDSRRRMRNSVDDYLKQEICLFPHSNELHHHQNTLDQLRLRLDRLQARASILRHGIDQREPAAS